MNKFIKCRRNKEIYWFGFRSTAPHRRAWSSTFIRLGSEWAIIKAHEKKIKARKKNRSMIFFAHEQQKSPPVQVHGNFCKQLSTSSCQKVARISIKTLNYANTATRRLARQFIHLVAQSSQERRNLRWPNGEHTNEFDFAVISPVKNSPLCHCMFDHNS